MNMASFPKTHAYAVPDLALLVLAWVLKPLEKKICELSKKVNVRAFHYIVKTAAAAQGLKEVIVDVAEKKDPRPGQATHQVYNMAREGTRNYEYRKKKSPASDSGQILVAGDFYEDNITPVYEVVNVRWA